MNPASPFESQIEDAVALVNDMLREGIIESYAIGGGMAISFYAEPIATRDVDFFVFLPPSPGKLVDLSRIYEYMTERGCLTGELDIYVGDIPIQFLPAYNDLTEEAVERAVDAFCGQTPTRVFRIEHVLAVMIQTDRDKDRDRLPGVFRGSGVDDGLLNDILTRHGLWDRWKLFWSGSREAQA